MQALSELGLAVARRRQALKLKQNEVALRAGLSPESLSRFENGHVTEFGSRKLLAVLGALGMELEFIESGGGGTLDELRKERGTGS